MISVAPGTTFEAWSQFATGSTVGVRIRDGAGADFLARTTTGITEDIAGSGVFRKSNFTAPTVAGQYELVWDDGTTFVIESLLVTYSASTFSPSGHEYVTTAELKATLSLTGQSYADADIALAVVAASQDIDDATGRRYWLDDDATSVRYYTPDMAKLLLIDDLVTLTSLTVDRTGDGTYEETWTVGTDFVLEPANAATDNKPYEQIRVRRNSGKTFPGVEQAAKVTGQFGWPTVPEQIRVAASILAGRYAKRAREAPFGVVVFGGDGVAARIQRTDPDVFALISGYDRRTFFL